MGLYLLQLILYLALQILEAVEEVVHIILVELEIQRDLYLQQAAPALSSSESTCAVAALGPCSTRAVPAKLAPARASLASSGA